MDLAIALKNMCRGQDKHSQLDMARVSAFIAAYKAEEPLTDSELAAIPTLLQAHRLRSLVARYERLCVAQRRKEHRTEKFLSELARLRWLKDHHNEIIDALHGRCSLNSESAVYAMTNPFVFIVGCSRSGTTLLQHVVAAHPQIAIIPETRWFLRWYEKRRWHHCRWNGDFGVDFQVAREAPSF